MLRRLGVLVSLVLLVYGGHVGLERLRALNENVNAAIWEARLPWMLDGTAPAAVTSTLKQYDDSPSTGIHLKFQNPSDAGLGMISAHARRFKKHQGWRPLIGVDLRTHAQATHRAVAAPAFLGPLQPRVAELLALMPESIFRARPRGLTAEGAGDLGRLMEAVGSSVEYILLSGNQIGATGMDAAVPSGLHLSKVKHLEAAACGLSEGEKHFQLLDRIPNAVHIDLSHNQMSGAHILSLFPITPYTEEQTTAPPCCRAVRYLDLAGNPMGTESATIFIDVVAKMMPKLESLRMDILVEGSNLSHLFSVVGTAVASQMTQLKALHIGLALGHSYSVDVLAEALNGLSRIKTETFELKISAHKYKVHSWLPAVLRKQLKQDSGDHGRDMTVHEMSTLAKTLQTLHLTKLAWLHRNSKTEGRKALKGVLKSIKQTRESHRGAGSKIKYDPVIYDDGVAQSAAPRPPPDEMPPPPGPAAPTGTDGLERWSDKVQQRRERAMQGRQGPRDEM